MVDTIKPIQTIKLQGTTPVLPTQNINAYEHEPKEQPVPFSYENLGAPVDIDVSTPVLDIRPDGATKIQSFVSGLAPTGRDLAGAFSEKMHFDVDESYDPKEDYDQFIELHSLHNPDEIKFLLSAPSKEAFNHRTERLLEKRDRDQALADNPISGIIGGVVDVDLPIAVLSGGGASIVKAGTATRRVIGAVGAGTTMAAANSAAGSASLRSDTEKVADIAIAALGGATSIIKARTTPLRPTSPNSTVSTAAILPEEAVVSRSLPKPVLPEGTVISPLPTSTITKTTSPNLSGLQYTSSTPVPTTTRLYHGTSVEYISVDPKKSGGIAFFAEDTGTAARYAVAEGGNRARLGDTDKYVIDSSVVYEFKGNQWVAVGLVDDTAELVTSSTLKPLDKDYAPLSTETVQERIQQGLETDVVPKSARIITQEFDNLNLIDLTTPEGRDLIAGLKPSTSAGDSLISAAKDDRIARNANSPQLNSSLWQLTKQSARWGSQLQKDIVDPLKALGYDGIRFTDDQHTTVGLFDTGLEKASKPVVGIGAKTQYQVPTTSTTATTPISGSGVLKQTQLSQAQLLDDLVDEELAAMSAPNSKTTISIPVTPSTRINLSSPLDDSGNELKLPSMSVEHKMVASLQSAADEVFFYTQGDVDNAMNRILASPYTQGDDAVTHGNAVLRDGEVRLVDFEQSIVKATKEIHGTTGLWGRLFGREHNRNLQQTSMDIYAEMQKIDQAVVQAAESGRVLSKEEINSLIDATNNVDSIKTSMKTYIESDFAQNMYDHIKRVGMMDEDALEQIVRRPTYMPVKHSYEAQKRFIDADLVNPAKRRVTVANFFGEQILRMYPDLARGIKGADGKVIKLTPQALGTKFMDNMKTRGENPNSVKTIGLSKDEIVNVLESQGVDLTTAKALANKLSNTRSAQQGEKHLRKRIDWDWTKTATAPDGTVFSMRDLVDQNAFHNIVDYNRRMSKRVGLAQYGFRTQQELMDAKAATIEALPKGVDIRKATEFLDNVINAASGNPVGGKVEDWIRSLNTMAGSLLLSGSGLYNAIELGVQVQRLGVLRSIPHMVEALKPVFNTMDKFSKAEAKSLNDVITGKLMSTDRWQNIMTHYADDFTVEGGFHEGVQFFGQSTRFLNGSEHIKRYQIGLFASVFVDAFKGAAKGSDNSIKFLKDGLRFSDELLTKTTKEWNKHGDNIDAWDADVRIAMEQKVFHEADNLAHVVHLGEVPSFMEFSTVGKIIFPFMRYLFAMQQKILRRTYIRDGAVGVAMVLAVQFPLAMMVAHTKRAMNGDKPYNLDNPKDVRDFIRSTLNGLSGIGSMAYPLDIILSGGQNMGSTITLAPIGRAVALGEDILSGEATARSFKEGTPANVILGLNLYLAAINGEGDDE